jgi:hypothetical protein
MNKLGKFGSLALPLFFITAMAWLAKPVFGQSDDREWPDIKNPGLDLGDFPNSAYTIPAGTCQVEFAPFGILGADRESQPEINMQFLLRFGLTDDVEFRVMGNGLTWNYTDPQFVGYSPLTLDGKVHLWDEKREWFLPATSLEVALTTDWGSKELSSGYQPTVSLNNDFALSETLNLEWTLGYGEVIGTLSTRSQNNALLTGNVNQVFFQWSLGKELTEKLQVFVTGETAQHVAGQSAGTTLAWGGSWQRSDRLMYYGIMGWGTTPDAPSIGAQLGLGYAFGRVRSR